MVMKILLLLFLLINSFGLYSTKEANRHFGSEIHILEMGTYKSKCRPGETIYYSMDMGRNWSVTFVTWIKKGEKKEYVLPINQTNGLGNSIRLFVDKKDGNILRIKGNDKILLKITGEKKFKSDDECEWNFVSDYLPPVN